MQCIEESGNSSSDKAGIPPDLSDAEVIEHLLSTLIYDNGLEAFQCEYCGRIWIEDSLSPTNYRSFRPEAKWRGTFEVHPQDFLAYEAEATFYGCHLESIERHKDTIDVKLKDWEGRMVVARFVGVKSIEEKMPNYSDPELNGLRVSHLGKWVGESPHYRYVFEDFYNGSDGSLSIVAQEFELVEVGVIDNVASA